MASGLTDHMWTIEELMMTVVIPEIQRKIGRLSGIEQLIEAIGALKIYLPLVLDCWELGCWPCQKIETSIDQMASDFKGKIVFGKLCTDFNPITIWSRKDSHPTHLQ
jgi:hypothetical protein